MNPTVGFVPEYRNFVVDEEQIRILLTTYWSENSRAINLRDIAIYDLNEIVTGQQFFNVSNPSAIRFSFRQAYSFGTIAAGVTVTQSHNITGVTSFTRIYGTAVTTAEYIPLPYVSTTALNKQVSLRVTSTDIEIVNGAGANDISSAIVILEYLKQ